MIDVESGAPAGGGSMIARYGGPRPIGDPPPDEDEDDDDQDDDDE